MLLFLDHLQFFCRNAVSALFNKIALKLTEMFNHMVNNKQAN